MNYTPLRFPLKTQSGPALGIIPVITFSVLLIAAAVITGAYLFAKTNQYNAKRNPEELQKYSVSRGTNIAATVAARVAQGPNAPTITDSPKKMSEKIQPTGQVAGVATQSAFFTPNYSATFPRCFNANAVNPGSDIKLLSVRCPLYLPKGTSQGDLTFMEDGNAVTLLKNSAVLFTLKKTAPDGLPAPVCENVHNYLNAGGAVTRECSMVKVTQNTSVLTVEGSTAASSLVENLTCKDETEQSCILSTRSIVIPIDGGIFQIIPLDLESEIAPIELNRVK